MSQLPDNDDLEMKEVPSDASSAPRPLDYVRASANPTMSAGERAAFALVGVVIAFGALVLYVMAAIYSFDHSYEMGWAMLFVIPILAFLPYAFFRSNRRMSVVYQAIGITLLSLTGLAILLVGLCFMIFASGR